MRPAYITMTRRANSAMTPRSWEISITAMPSSRAQIAQQFENLRLDRHVQRGRRLVTFRDNVAPARSRRGHADPEEAQRGFGENSVGEDEGQTS